VPKELRDKWYGEGKDKMLKKMYGVEVLMEQELATSDESIKVRQYIANKEKELGGGPIAVEDWALFSIK